MVPFQFLSFLFTRWLFRASSKLGAFWHFATVSVSLHIRKRSCPSSPCQSACRNTQRPCPSILVWPPLCKASSFLGASIRSLYSILAPRTIILAQIIIRHSRLGLIPPDLIKDAMGFSLENRVRTYIEQCACRVPRLEPKRSSRCQSCICGGGHRSNNYK